MILPLMLALAAQAAPSGCPVFSVVGNPVPGQPTSATFKVVFIEDDPAGVGYKWSVSAGSIVGPAGGASITVKGAPGAKITATALVSGLPKACPAKLGESVTLGG